MIRTGDLSCKLKIASHETHAEIFCRAIQPVVMLSDIHDDRPLAPGVSESSEKGRTDETLLQQATEASETLCHPEQPNKRRRVLSKKGAHYLEDPNLRLLRRALREVDIPCSTVKVASPLSGDTRQQPFAGNLLDLLLRGEGGVGSGCRVSRLEMATVSAFYAGLATHEQPSHTMHLHVGHAGVELLVEAVYTKEVELDGESVVDLLQVASYLQVECCLLAGGQFLLDHAMTQCAEQVVAVITHLGVQSLKEQLCKCLARRFFRIEPSTLAAALKGLGTQMAVQLLQRHSLCCPLECFLVEVLAYLAVLDAEYDLSPLLKCVRWGAMSDAELQAATLFIKGKTAVPPAVRAALLGWLAEEAGKRLLTKERSAFAQRGIAARTIQLMVAADDGGILDGKSPIRYLHGVGRVFVKASMEGEPQAPCVGLYGHDGAARFAAGTVVRWLAFDAHGFWTRRLGPIPAMTSTVKVSSQQVEKSLKRPLCQAQDMRKMVLVGFCILEK